MAWQRRKFLKYSGIGGSLLPISPAIADGKTTPVAPGKNPGVKAYRRLGRTELKISDVSFGASRLREGEENLVHHALDLGVNYIDTAESYTGGASENVVGRALKGKRDKVILASKQFAGTSTSKESMREELEASLRRLQTDHIDVYFNHAVNDTGRLANPEWGEFVERAKQDGKISYTGISGHAGRLVENIEYALTHNLVDVLLVGYNFGQDPAFYERLTKSFDMVARQPELPRVLAQAKKQDVGVIAMKTLMGARLNDMRAFENGGATFAQAAFRWTLSNPDVDALIISMTSTQKIDEFVAASGTAPVGSDNVSATDMDLLGRYARVSGSTYCRHACNDCSGACPYNVPIADVMRTRMYATDYEDLAFARDEYAQLASNASPCLTCDGSPCAGACTHGIDIAALCAPTHSMLS